MMAQSGSPTKIKASAATRTALSRDSAPHSLTWLPRVRRAKDLKFVDGPQTFSRHYVEPKDGMSQLFHIHL